MKARLRALLWHVSAGRVPVVAEVFRKKARFPVRAGGVPALPACASRRQGGSLFLFSLGRAFILWHNVYYNVYFKTERRGCKPNYSAVTWGPGQHSQKFV